MQRIDVNVNERITALERLKHFSKQIILLPGRLLSGSGLFAAKFIFERFPSGLASISKMEVVIKDSSAKITANTKTLNLIIRDSAGVPEILTRLNSPSSPLGEIVPKYES